MTGFPTLQFMDAEGTTLTVQGDRSVEGFDSTLVQVSRMEDLRKRMAGGEKGLGADLFLAELALGKVSWEEAQEKAKGFSKLTGAQKKELGQLMLDTEIKHIVAGVGRDDEKLIQAGKRIEEILASGMTPSPAVQATLWGFVLRYADKIGDAELYAKAVEFTKKRYADEPRAKSYLERLDARLKELQAGPDA
ncbi:MAG: hypothetical protein ISR76_07480 [Planctomycetes bacterium]|nr:hypothetical protein [Planctomycetota bacterium]MBL7008824.1 hypothetical protein [Planctomycetota bacterium]